MTPRPLQINLPNSPEKIIIRTS